MSTIRSDLDWTMRRQSRWRRGWSASVAPAVLYWVLAWAWIAALVYGSLLPFRFLVPAHLDHLGGWLDVDWWWSNFVPLRPGWLRWHRLINGDAPINVLLYVPVDLLLRLRARARLQGRVWQIVIPIAAVGLLSLLIECTQVLEPMRVSSIEDWWANLAGGVIGTVVVLPMVLLLRRVIFVGYCQTVAFRQVLANRWQHRRAHPRLSAWLGMAVVAVVGVAAGLHTPGHDARVVWLPFYDQFFYSYNLAAKWVLWDLMCWTTVAGGLLAAIEVAGGAGRWWALVAATVALAVGRQMIFLALGRRADATDVVLAVTSVGLLWLGTWIVRRAVAASCRRKQARAVPFERRRAAHAYEARG